MIVIKFGFVGAGKVGFSLGKYFKENGILITGYYSKNHNSAKEAAEFTGTKAFLNLQQLVQESNVIFITTPDGEIEGVWNELKELSINNKLICHCSGLLSSEIFSDISKFGAYPYSIHPMFAMSDKYNSFKNFRKAFITIEGHEKYINKFTELFKSLGNSVKIIDKENKSLYHLASVISSNLVLGLINNGVDYLKHCGFSEELAIDALYPLISNNIENIKVSGTVKSLTGPLERGDLSTMQTHMLSLSEEDKILYRALNNNLLKVAKKKNPNKDYREIEEFLGEEM